MAERESKPTLENQGQEGNIVESDYILNQFGETVSLSGTKRTSDGADAEEMDAPTSLGRYEIRGILGKGGFGAVYKGYDQQLARQVAIKVPLLRNTEGVEKLFLQEARQLAQLTHPNIVTVHDVDVDSGTCYIVSEYLKGKDLNHYLKGTKISWREAAGLIATLADALAFAHSLGTVHRDVKPANIIMVTRGEETSPVVFDFGLALSESTGGSDAAQRGRIVGTPNFMSPEQARGEGHRIDGRTDIYALGVILYRMLCGQLPFIAKNLRDLLEKVTSDEPRPPRQFVRGIPRELERICLKAMAKSISDRYTTAGDLSEDLRNLLQEEGGVIEASPQPSKPKESNIRREAAQILIADDHELSRFKLQSDLEKWGHEVTAAEDGEQAWELFQKNQYPIVITDWMMPKLDGLELVKMIRSATASGDYTYIVMLTAKAEKHDIVAGMGAGADDFLAKPFHRDELQIRVRAGIRTTNLYRELKEATHRLDRSQEAAGQIQRLFLPTTKPKVEGYDFAWGYEPCGNLGGDMLNVVPLDDQHIGVFVLDVTGDGVPAALLATTLSRVMAPASDAASILVENGENGETPRIREPLEVARQLNKQFGVQEGKQFFTMAYGVLNRESREFQFVSTGHPPILHQSTNASPRMIDVDGFPIGMAPDSDEFEQRTVQLEKGDRLLIYSDGLPDAMNAQGDVFGAAQLLDCATRLNQESLDGTIQSLMNELRAWRDGERVESDVSILALEVL